MNKETVNPECTHCGYEFDDEETWHSTYSKSGKVSTGDCDVSELICPNLDCGKTFYTACVHNVMFKKVDSDGDDI